MSDQGEQSGDGLPENAADDPNRTGEDDDGYLQAGLNADETWTRGLAPPPEPVEDYGPFMSEEIEENIRLRILRKEEWQKFSTRKALDRFYWRAKDSATPCPN